MAYWADIDTDPNQQMWTLDGGSVNIHGKVFGTDGGGSVTNGYTSNKITSNPDKIFSTHIMAGFLGIYFLLLIFRYGTCFKKMYRLVAYP